MAARALTGMITPEFYFQKTIDNSRLVRVADPRRKREVRMLSIAFSLLFLVAMIYTWQHFRSLEYSYQIEVQKTEHDRLLEVNRNLKLEQAGVRDPGRIDVLARQMNLEPAHPGQVVRLDSDAPDSTAVIAQLPTVAIIPAQ